MLALFEILNSINKKISHFLNDLQQVHQYNHGSMAGTAIRQVGSHMWLTKLAFQKIIYSLYAQEGGHE
jgi:hypothetical protein